MAPGRDPMDTNAMHEPMALPADLLTRPAAETARILAWFHLGNARAARRRLGSPEDSEALHDFRVALRRLRSVLQDWRRPTSDTVPGRYLRHLRRLARATGPSRDLEVRLALCDRFGGELPTNTQPGLSWLRSHLEGLRHSADLHSATAVAEGMPELEGDLAARLERYRVELDLAAYRPQPGTTTVLAALVEEAITRVHRRLALVHGIEDQQPAHRARIAVKRLRYLLEPFRRELPGAREVVATLVTLQDLLGDHRDAAGLATEIENLLASRPVTDPHQIQGHVEADERTGLAALAGRLRAQAAEEFARVRADWLGDQAALLLADVSRLVLRLRAMADPLEIERKYLLRGLPEMTRATEPLEVEQGYLPGALLRERLRRTSLAGEVTCWRSIKAGRGVTRIEVEEEIAAELFDRLWPLTEGSRVVKRRYRIPDGDVVWEIDEFLERDLVLAEVELETEAMEVTLPDWIRELVVREVTGEAEFLNSTLAR
jgi:CHAD domain-containing protein/CYTH domain-containing protein